MVKPILHIISNNAACTLIIEDQAISWNTVEDW